MPTMKQAVTQKDAEKWEEAIGKKINGLEYNGNWRIESIPLNTRVLPTKILLILKRKPERGVDKYKARLVASGNYQLEK